MSGAVASDEVGRFFGHYPHRTFGKGELLLRPSATLPGIFYMTEGLVSQYDITPSGNEVVVNIFKPGAFFPMAAALNRVPNRYFFEAVMPVEAHIVPPEDAVRFLRDNPGVTLDLLSRVYRGTDGVLRRMAHLMGGDATTRLLFELLNSAYRFGDIRPDGSILIPLSEGDIARYAGLARETVSRQLQSFKASDLLEVSHRSVTILDPHKLEELLGEIV